MDEYRRVKRYSIRATCKLLSIDRATLYRWLHSAGIEIHRDALDFRFRYLTRTELTLLALKHKRSIIELPETLTLTERVERLEAQVEHLTELLNNGV